MPLDALTQNDVALLGRALHVMAAGTIIEEFEFCARIGVELPEFRQMLAKWPDWDDGDDRSPECLAINNTIVLGALVVCGRLR